MALSTAATVDELGRPRGLASPTGLTGFSGPWTDTTRSQNSAVSWGAIGAGAAAAASLSLILLMLGMGLGLSSVSPWAADGISASNFGLSTVLWLLLTQLLASALGGYLAGRLRTKWTGVHRDEVFFRDTAHGFLSWAVASLATAALLTSAIGTILGGGIQAGASMVGGVAATAGTAAAARPRQGGDGGPMAYFVDTLYRRDPATAATADANERAVGMNTVEVSRIFMNVTRAQPLPADDLRYVGQIVAQRTGLSQVDAQKRVAEVFAQAQARTRDAEIAARVAANTARKASAQGALWLFVSLLVGAFIASLAATFGGRRRDA